MKNILRDILVMVAIVVTAGYLYSTYGERVIATFRGTEAETIYIDNLALRVTVADEPAERTAGLSGVKSLEEREGKLFVFDQEGDHGIWMKDMLIPLDIIWINNQYEVVHIEERVSPDSFPAIFNSPEPARFVLEVNAFFVDSFKVQVGDKVTIPAGLLPTDLRNKLLETE